MKKKLKPNKESARETYERKKAAGLVKRSLWVYPDQWEKIKRRADKMTDRERILRDE